MKEIKVTVNTWYVVEGAAGATVINPLTNRAIATVEDGKQASFLATTPYVVASDDSVNVFKAPFNSAPAKLKLLGLLGGGSSTGLPSGYIEALFLESTGTQKIVTDVVPTINTGIYGDLGAKFGRWAGSRTGANWVAPAISYGAFQYFYFASAKSMGTPPTEEAPYISTLNWLNSRKATFAIASQNFSKSNSLAGSTTSGITAPIALFCDNASSSGHAVRICSVKISEDVEIINEYIPVLDDAGTPCLYDRINEQFQYNSGTGAFIVGMTVEQAKKLSKLPVGGGALTISLPSSIVSGSTVTDSEVDAALTTARSKGWNITVLDYTEEATAAASTFGMQRIWVRTRQDENGSYVDADGTRWQVDWCVTMYTTDDSTPDQHGYELFRSVEAACEYWGLTEYVDPDEENLLTETN